MGLEALEAIFKPGADELQVSLLSSENHLVTSFTKKYKEEPSAQGLFMTEPLWTLAFSLRWRMLLPNFLDQSSTPQRFSMLRDAEQNSQRKRKLWGNRNCETGK